ncbi:MAG TPA: hypothetical protein VFK85_13970 [Anaeromyxobacteraceae bacterium]|nr:hypothetical protein [Anaeromyxobacteraceae bacterium]
MNRLRLVALAMLAIAAGAARADTIRANSTTLLLSRENAIQGQLEHTLPIFEIMSITASDVSTSFAQDVEVALSLWGAVDLNDVRAWQGGSFTDRRVSGDVDVAYVKGDLLDRRLTVRVGRQMVPDGTSRMVHLDGGQIRLRLPANFGVSAFAGSPVSPRFGARGGLGYGSIGNTRANFATGGRVFYYLPARLEVGASTMIANDRGDPSRRDLGADFRVFLPSSLQLAGSAFYSLYDERLGEGEASLSWRGSRRLQAAAEYRHVEPDLFLPRTSILSVFANDERNEVGGWARLEPLRALVLDVDYHALLEDPGTGHRARARGIYTLRPRTDVGAEAAVLVSPGGTQLANGGYWMARAFGAHGRGPFDVTVDVVSYFLERSINGEDLALTATGTVGWRFMQGFKVLVAGTGGTTPYLTRHFDVLAKLVYDQIYVTREVR